MRVVAIFRLGVLVGLVAGFIILFSTLFLNEKYCKDCICPGVGVGPVSLGATKRKVIDISGLPAQHVDVGDVFYLAYPSKGILYSGNNSDGVVAISLFGPGDGMLDVYKGEVVGFRGKIGGKIGIGSLRSDVESYFSGPVVGSDDIYNRRYSGVFISFDQDSKVSLIQVRQKAD